MNFYDKYQAEFREYDAMTRDFIDDDKIWDQLHKAANSSKTAVRKVLAKAERKVRLDPEEMAILIQNQDQGTIEEMYALANKVKREVYGDRIVFFAPLYISNKCANNCRYCGFRRENKLVERRTLTLEEIADEVKTMISEGQKRTVLVYGESPETGIDFICDSVRQVYRTKWGNGEIRRANINCAPLSRAELAKLKEVGIGTFQVFQETYHHQTYREMHPAGTIKSHYRWRLYAQDRALDAGLDDVAIGALFGLYDWRFELMGLLYHTIHLEEKYNGVGPHTISFPRIEPAIGTPFSVRPKYAVSDAEFKKIVAIMRLAVPYAGLILTAREKPEVRREVLPLGVTQIDAGTRIGVGGYRQAAGNMLPAKEQFQLGDTRSLDQVVYETCLMGNFPSFCTACYRVGRTGEDFMAVAKSSFVHNFCMPNAILTLKEYLLDFASEETRKAGDRAIQQYVDQMAEGKRKDFLRQALARLEQGERDIRV
ncbi:[FeFe] hydrogenase H-cluster radical SAM maturase HydG [Capillibacterium thermochitinicola]|uniref:[FeFe] hydrogenase H-cluster radical SAM maturase HydG n=1 Tax=Capillibacterium thermochitinicola TaxID=2699427 RepID=A0A8J6I1U5_9FIRM|nr:[FeFe] hydrogenase H-cluster radical SAM maturase HydG [Capillibacterium thermochitinicola]MBA2132727.1 [FeFe] hydrogenase H-cluster radical SAM maturase HydG [Capillibacterium thermochitinicola]